MTLAQITDERKMATTTATLHSSLCKINATINLQGASKSTTSHTPRTFFTRQPIHKTIFRKPQPNLFFATRKHVKICLATDSDQAATQEASEDSSNVEESGDESSQIASSNAQAGINGSSPQITKESAPRRAPLTAREKLRAARVLSKYTQPKPSKPEFGSKVLDALRETDKGKKKKRSGLPEAPTNLFDDSKRGLPKEGWTFDLPVGTDILVVLLSFVLITTVMFATTYVVWKLGAIHFNE